jgi:hypothetical protein
MISSNYVFHKFLKLPFMRVSALIIFLCYIYQVQQATAADVHKAVQAAKVAFESGEWNKMNARDRGLIMYRYWFCMGFLSLTGRPTHRWIDNIKMDLLEIGVSVVDWIGLAEDRYRWRALVNVVMNHRVP